MSQQFQPQAQGPEALRSIHIKTFGCQMNVYDSDRMNSLLVGSGYRMEADVRKADVILINTCSIRDKSEHKVLSLLGQLKPLKDKDPSKILGVSGCVGQRMGRSLLQRVPHLDLVFGPDSVDRVVPLIEEVRKGNRLVEAKFDTGSRVYSQPGVFTRAKPAEFLTIMKGCDHFCTYCIVPFVRGREKSRSIAEIVGDVSALAAKGTKEICFLGQNINTFGKGTPERLSKLIEETDKLPGIERIRYLTSHPRDLGQDLIDQFGVVEKLCPALHLPFQSGSDAILKKMARLYTSAEYLEKVRLLRKACPDIALTTDVIVGFPGETEEDFKATVKVLEEVVFMNAYLFKYSPRPGTRAFSGSEPEVPESVKDERLKIVQEINHRNCLLQNNTAVGKTQPILIEALDKKKRHFSGRDPQWRLTHVTNLDETSIGKILDIEITGATGSNLMGHHVRH